MAQLAAFTELFGRAPDFVDGHQHAQLFPAGARRVSGGGEGGRARRLGAPGRPPSAAGAAARRAQGVGSRRPERAIPPAAPRAPASPSIPDLPAPMIFRRQPDFGALMRQFLDGLPEGGLDHVPSRLRRRNPGQPRSAHRPSANMNTLFSAASISRACWRRTKLHWADTAARNARRASCRIPKFNSGSTTGDTKRPYISPALRQRGRRCHDTARTPIGRRSFRPARASWRARRAIRTPPPPSRKACARRPMPSTRWCRPCWCRTKRSSAPTAASRNWKPAARRANPVRRLPRFDARYDLRAEPAARLGAERPAARAPAARSGTAAR